MNSVCSDRQTGRHAGGRAGGRTGGRAGRQVDSVEELGQKTKEADLTVELGDLGAKLRGGAELRPVSLYYYQ